PARPPEEERSEEPPRLPLGLESLHDPGFARPHPAADVADVRPRLATNVGIHQRRWQPPREPGRVAMLAISADEIVALAERREERRNVLRAVLEVGVEHDDPAATDEIEAGARG